MSRAFVLLSAAHDNPLYCSVDDYKSGPDKEDQVTMAQELMDNEDCNEVIMYELVPVSRFTRTDVKEEKLPLPKHLIPTTTKRTK